LPHLNEEDLVQVWRGRLARGIEERKKISNEVWEPNLAAYRGELRPSDDIWDEDDVWVHSELVFSAIRSAVPTLLYQNPKWSLTPKKPILEDSKDISWERAKSQELWVDHVWGETKGNRQVRNAIVDSFLALGCIRVGYHPVFADDEKRGEFEFDEQTGDLIYDGEDTEGNPLPRLAKGELAVDEDGNFIFDDDTGLPVLHPGKLLSETFSVESVRWDRFVFDTEGGSDYRKHRWVAEEWVRPLNEIREDPRSPEAVRDKIRATESLDSRIADPSKPEMFASTVPDADVSMAALEDGLRVRGWTIYDFVEDRMYELAEHVQDGHNETFLLNQRIPESMEHGPYVFLKWNEDPGRWYPRTDVEGAAKLELEHNLTRSQILSHRLSAKPRTFEVANEGFVDDLEREKYASGPANEVVKVKTKDGVFQSEKSRLDGAFFTSPPEILAMFSQIMGVSTEQQGVSKADSATQASIAASGADLRNSDRRDNLVHEFISDIGRKLLQAGAAHADGSIWAKVQTSPDDPQPFTFTEVNPNDLKGEFNVDVAIGSTLAQNSQTRVQILERMVLLISQNPLIAASRTLMERMFNAIDINDDKLLDELQALGLQVLQQQGISEVGEEGGDPEAAAAGGGEIPEDIKNQFVDVINQAAGTPTGAPSN
jgi:hypothetical protein